MSRLVMVHRPGHPLANERGMVDASLVGHEDSDPRVYVASDRHYENQKAPDGTDISSAKKHRAWVKENNLVYFGDTSPAWRERRKKAAAQQQRSDIRSALIDSYKRHRRY